jgi:hypothetical protein
VKPWPQVNLLFARQDYWRTAPQLRQNLSALSNFCPHFTQNRLDPVAGAEALAGGRTGASPFRRASRRLAWRDALVWRRRNTQ